MAGVPNLQKARKLKKFSRIELGKIIGFSKDTVKSWEVGANRPSLDELKTLSKVLNVSVDYLLGINKRIGMKEIKDSFQNLTKKEQSEILYFVLEIILDKEKS